jgi:hypothetical protein
MPKAKLIYDWVTLNKATQLEAAKHFGVNQGYISRALRSWAKRMDLPLIDNRRKA